MNGIVKRLFPASRTMIVFAAIMLTAGIAAESRAQDGPETAALTVPVEVLAIVSGGLWRGNEEEQEAEDDAETASGRGYYRAIAVRSPNNTSRLYFQKIDLSSGKPVIIETMNVQELETMTAYITDMRPENSTGTADYEGFAVYVYLKEDPAAAEPDTWELFVDEFGDHEFLPASN